jgi:hypothetical protein
LTFVPLVRSIERHGSTTSQQMTTPPPGTIQTTGQRPTFLGALRGVWSFTWKSQLTWRRLPAAVVNLLLIPMLVYLTVSTPDSWSQRQHVLDNAVQDSKNLIGRLTRSDKRLDRAKQAQIQRVFSEEYLRTEQEIAQTSSSITKSLMDARDKSASRTGRRKDLAKACFARIRQRLQTEGLLAESQQNQFEAFETRRMMEVEARLNQPMWSRSAPFYHWLIDIYFFVLLPLSCVGACGALIREELQLNTLGFLTTRPLTRARLVALKYLAQTAWLQLVLLVEAGLFFLAGHLRAIPALTTLAPLFLAAQLLAVLAWCALGTFLGLISKRYMAIALVYGFIVEMGIGRIPTNINHLSVIRNLKSILANNPALQDLYDWPTKGAFVSVLPIAAASLVFLACAALLFTYKEYHHTAEMQK